VGVEKKLQRRLPVQAERVARGRISRVMRGGAPEEPRIWPGPDPPRSPRGRAGPVLEAEAGELPEGRDLLIQAFRLGTDQDQDAQVVLLGSSLFDVLFEKEKS